MPVGWRNENFWYKTYRKWAKTQNNAHTEIISVDLTTWHLLWGLPSVGYQGNTSWKLSPSISLIWITLLFFANTYYGLPYPEIPSMDTNNGCLKLLGFFPFFSSQNSQDAFFLALMGVSEHFLRGEFGSPQQEVQLKLSLNKFMEIPKVTFKKWIV